MSKLILLIGLLFSYGCSTTGLINQQAKLSECYRQLAPVFPERSTMAGILPVLRNAEEIDIPFVLIPGFQDNQNPSSLQQGLFLLTTDDALFYPVESFLEPGAELSVALRWQTILAGQRFLRVNVHAQGKNDWSLTATSLPSGDLLGSVLDSKDANLVAANEALAGQILKLLSKVNAQFNTQKKLIGKESLPRLSQRYSTILTSCSEAQMPSLEDIIKQSQEHVQDIPAVPSASSEGSDTAQPASKAGSQ